MIRIKIENYRELLGVIVNEFYNIRVLKLILTYDIFNLGMLFLTNKNDSFCQVFYLN